METDVVLKAIESFGILGVLVVIIVVVVKWLDKKDTQLEEKNKLIMDAFTKNSTALSSQAEATRGLTRAVEDSSKVSTETLNMTRETKGRAEKNGDILDDIDNFIKNKHA